MMDSIAAVEAAWSRLAREIGAGPRVRKPRAIDNLAHFKPHLRAHEIATVVESFERSILFLRLCMRARARAPCGGQHLRSCPMQAPAPALSLARLRAVSACHR